MNSVPHAPYGSVYYIHNTVSHRIYIGITTQRPAKRKAFHCWALRHNRHYNPRLQRAWNKYGEGVFEFGVLEACESQQALDEAERFYIEYLGAIGAALYNLKDGGGFGGKPSIESRQRMSKAGRGRPKSEETRRRMSEGSRGVKRQRTPEGEARRIAAQRVANQAPEYREKRRQGALGRKHTAESRQHMSTVQSLRFGITYHLTGPDGATYATQTLRQFCDAHGLKYRNIRNIVDGLCKTSQGWTVTVERKRPPE